MPWMIVLWILQISIRHAPLRRIATRMWVVGAESQKNLHEMKLLQYTHWFETNTRINYIAGEWISARGSANANSQIAMESNESINLPVRKTQLFLILFLTWNLLQLQLKPQLNADTRFIQYPWLCLHGEYPRYPATNVHDHPFDRRLSTRMNDWALGRMATTTDSHPSSKINPRRMRRTRLQQHLLHSQYATRPTISMNTSPIISKCAAVIRIKSFVFGASRYVCSVEYVGGDNVSNANEHNREFNWQPNFHSLRLVLVVDLLDYRFAIALFDGNLVFRMRGMINPLPTSTISSPINI